MRKPELTSPLAQELWTIYNEEVAPRLANIDGVNSFVQGMMMSYLDDALPGFFEALDQDADLQASIIARVRAAIEKIDGPGSCAQVTPIGPEDERDLYPSEDTQDAENENTPDD